MEAVNLSNLFIEKGQEIVSTKGKIQQLNRVHKTSKQPVEPDIPVVVLVNRSSASASEIVSGAIQDLDRGVVIGQRTYGKGLVQTVKSLSYNTKLKITTAKYYIPSGRCIQALDYSHRNEDGSVGKIPDSLISEFTTKNGRKVYDGGGIRPDIEIEPENLSKISISLLRKHFIFDFATQYRLQHDSIPTVKHFEITEQDFADFIEFIKDKDFDYETKSEETFEELKKIAKHEKYYDIAKEEFDLLKKKLAHDKEKDLRVFKEEIKKLLAGEIISRYYYQKGSIQFAIKTDTEIEKAIEILSDSSLYNSILDGTYVPENNNEEE